MQRAVFLDRDNTIIHNDEDLGDPSRVKLIQGAASAIASLRGLGYKIVVVTNQGGVARGKFTEADVEAVNRRVAELVKQSSGAAIDRFYYCPYHPKAVVEQYKREHPWRKPQPGMLLQAAKDLNLDLRLCWLVGDQPRDVEAGKTAGVHTVLLGELRAAEDGAGDPDFTARSLVEAVRIIAQQPRAVEPKAEPAPTPPSAFEPTILPPAQLAVPPLTPADAGPLFSNVETRVELDPPRPEVPPAPADPPRADHTDFPTDIRESGDPGTQVLVQILRELKHQRVHHDDFSWSRMAAVVLQTITLGCILFALFQLKSPSDFAQWMLGAIFGQLAVIAALLNGKK